MKKILSTILVFAITLNFASCQAKGLVQVSDYGAESFLGFVKQLLASDNSGLVAGDLFRTANADMPEYGYYAWAALYGLENSSQPDGEILFSANGQGYVSTLKVISYSNQNAETAMKVFAACFVVLGGNSTEFKTLLDNFEGNDTLKMSVVRCQAANREFLVTLLPRVEASDGFQFLIMADN